jgi:hypothetical protein
MTAWRKSSFSATNATCIEVAWKSSFCGTGACVEVAHDSDEDEIFVRDSKNPDTPPLRFNRDEWDAFIAGVKAGEFG